MILEGAVFPSFPRDSEGITTMDLKILEIGSLDGDRQAELRDDGCEIEALKKWFKRLGSDELTETAK